MAKKGFNCIKPNHEEYVENFNALTNGLNNGSQERDIVIKQVDHLLDKWSKDYPEILMSYQEARLVEEAGKITAMEVAVL